MSLLSCLIKKEKHLTESQENTSNIIGQPDTTGRSTYMYLSSLYSTRQVYLSRGGEELFRWKVSFSLVLLEDRWMPKGMKKVSAASRRMCCWAIEIHADSDAQVMLRMLLVDKGQYNVHDKGLGSLWFHEFHRSNVFVVGDIEFTAIPAKGKALKMWPILQPKVYTQCKPLRKTRIPTSKTK